MGIGGNGRRFSWVMLLIGLVLVADQCLKIWVKTHLHYGEEFSLFGQGWLSIHFVENNGMAFGFSLRGMYGKILLSLFRILAVGFLSYFVYRLIVEMAPGRVLVAFSLILAGALGNILDSAFYGLIFSESYFHGSVARLFPPEGGYAGFLQGKVVDMLHLPFFKPVFNIADLAISSGVILLIICYRDFFRPVSEAGLPVSAGSNDGDGAPTSHPAGSEAEH